MSLSPHSPFPRARALWTHLKAPSSGPGAAQAFPVSSSLSLSLAAPKWEMTANKTHCGGGQRWRNPIRLLQLLRGLRGWCALSPGGGERRACALENRFPAPGMGGPRAPVELGAPVPVVALWKVGSRHRPGGRRQRLQCSVGSGAWPGNAEQAGSGRQAAGGRRTGWWLRSRPQAPRPVPGSRGRHCGTRSPAPPVGHRERLLLFGEEAESLLLVFFAEVYIRAGVGGQGQALSLDADALGLVDGRTHTLQPAQHLLLQGRTVRAPRLPVPAKDGAGCPRTAHSESLEVQWLGSPSPALLLAGVWARLPCTYLILAMEEPLTAIAQPRRTKGFLPCGHLWSPLPGQRAGSDPTEPSER